MARTKGAKSKNHKLKYYLIYESLQNFVRKEKEKGELPTADLFKEKAEQLLGDNGFRVVVGLARLEQVIQKQAVGLGLKMFRQLQCERDGKLVKFIDVVEK